MKHDTKCSGCYGTGFQSYGNIQIEPCDECNGDGMAFFKKKDTMKEINDKLVLGIDAASYYIKTTNPKIVERPIEFINAVHDLISYLGDDGVIMAARDLGFKQ